MIQLRAITGDNHRACLRLRASVDKAGFVDSVSCSLAKPGCIIKTHSPLRSAGVKSPSALFRWMSGKGIPRWEATIRMTAKTASTSGKNKVATVS